MRPCWSGLLVINYRILGRNQQGFFHCKALNIRCYQKPSTVIFVMIEITSQNQEMGNYVDLLLHKENIEVIWRHSYIIYCYEYSLIRPTLQPISSFTSSTLLWLWHFFTEFGLKKCQNALIQVIVICCWHWCSQHSQLYIESRKCIV